ncbi:YceI family protein [Antarcticibacterium sp. 1MA-6-2]|uniref:YceI family protein n=1 Tax=Antarcticibacterium sp. 1MA-6-2 TaxID=2908210 RepID=UPI001F32E505|nr:YceI family protein [Antarcticibacterium sp. 1MA-6-2]UJH90754.1 YceI family protein [Antarcticibacterium sp. 1MA-6-2]
MAEFADGQLVKINQLEFAVQAESLKSGKSGMDKNTYKALKTDSNKDITYKLNKVNNIDCVTAGSCKVTTSGTLTIAGTSKPVEITFDAKVTGDKVTLTGSKSLKMTEFKVDPPTAMFGTITTGDQVNIKFQSTFSK